MTGDLLSSGKFGQAYAPCPSRWGFELRLRTRCGTSGIRTHDILLAKQTLYQLSYGPVKRIHAVQGIAARLRLSPEPVSRSAVLPAAASFCTWRGLKRRRIPAGIQCGRIRTCKVKGCVHPAPRPCPVAVSFPVAPYALDPVRKPGSIPPCGSAEWRTGSESDRRIAGLQPAALSFRHPFVGCQAGFEPAACGPTNRRSTG